MRIFTDVSGQWDAVPATGQNGHALVEAVVIAGLGRIDVRGNPESLRPIQAARGNRHALAVLLFEEQAGAAFLAEATAEAGAAGKPFE